MKNTGGQPGSVRFFGPRSSGALLLLAFAAALIVVVRLDEDAASVVRGHVSNIKAMASDERMGAMMTSVSAKATTFAALLGEAK